MNFNETQSTIIYNIVMKYNSDVDFSIAIQNLYNTEPLKLSILEIYAIEEVLRFGTKGLYNRFSETKGNFSESQAVEQYDAFIKLLNEDTNFNQYKKEQLKNAPESLSKMEIFAFSLMIKDKKEKTKNNDEEKIKEENKLEYDPLNPILYATDQQIRETLENLLMGEFIGKILELPSMQSVKSRQKKDGRIANIDKQTIIDKIKIAISDNMAMYQFKQKIDTMYLNVKLRVLTDNNESSFELYSHFNTNISANEVFGIERKNTTESMMDYMNDLINKKRQEEKGMPKR